MRRNNKRKQSVKQESGPNVTIPADNFYGQMAMDTAMVPKTVPNYVFSDRHHHPEVVFHRVRPWASFVEGWHYNDLDVNYTYSDIDSVAADGFCYMGRTVAELEALDMHPANPMARNFQREVWPLYASLFSYGLNKTNTAVGFAEFVYVMGRQIKLAATYTDIINMMYVLDQTENFGVFKHNARVMRNSLLPQRAAIRERMDQIEGALKRLPTIPRIMQEVARIKAPFVSAMGALPNLCVPYTDSVLGTTTIPSNYLDTLLTKMETAIQYLEGDFHETLNEMRLRMPAVMGDFFSRGMLEGRVIIDIFKTEARLNSIFSERDVHGDTGEPNNYPFLKMTTEGISDGFIDYSADFERNDIIALTAGESDANAATRSRTWMSLSPIFSGAALISSSIWVVDTSLIDDRFTLISPHMWSEARVAGFSLVGSSTINLLAVDSFYIPESYKHLIRAVLGRVIQEDTDEFYLPEGFPQRVVPEEVIRILDQAADYFFDIGSVTAVVDRYRGAANP